MKNRKNKAIVSRRHNEKQAPEKKDADARGGLPIEKIANAVDAATYDGFEVFEVETKRGGSIQFSLPGDDARDAERLLKKALRKNANFPNLPKKTLMDLLARVIDAQPKEHWVHAPAVGWYDHEGCITYTLTDRVIGRQQGPIKIKPPLWLNRKQTLAYSQKGTLEGWKKSVAGPSIYSTRLILAISASIASMLVRFVGIAPFMLGLFGDSKVGKSTTLLVGGTFFGLGEERDLSNWGITKSGFFEYARLTNDGLLPLNELRLAKERRADIYPHVAQTVFAYSEARDLTRNSGSSYSSDVGSSRFSGIAFSTAERSFSRLAEASREERDDGELARAHCVPATRENRKTIFDRPPSKSERGGESVTVWGRKRLVRLRKACAKHYGHAVDLVVARVAKLGFEATSEMVKGWTSEYLAASPKQSDGVLGYAARNFALLYAGGRMAIELGLVPWDVEMLLEAILLCFEDFLAEERAGEMEDDRVLEMIEAKLTPKNFSRMQKDAWLDDEPEFGFYKRFQTYDLYCIRATVFSTWIGSNSRTRRILERLQRAERLVVADKAKSRPHSNKDWAETTMKWCKDRKFRAVRIRVPREA